MREGLDGAPTATFEDFLEIDKFKNLLWLFAYLDLGNRDLPANYQNDLEEIKSKQERNKDFFLKRFCLSSIESQDLENEDYFLHLLDKNLKKVINGIPTSHFEILEHQIRTKYILESEALFRLIELNIEYFQSLLPKINYSDHLYSYKPLIRKTIEYCIQKLHDEFLPKSFLNPEDNKIKFNLSKKEVCLLFTRLANDGIISIEQSGEKELGALIETHFLFNDSKSKSYRPITQAYKTIQKNRQDPRHQTESEKLNNLFK
ncbi:hypothetical protein [Robertkochia flava]|uniref:hypothetical protein n=1 Tax=Robertkochia flava TaxID=3447986 RepID=UPI001CC9BD24|nr:hypothetical protein [Robertkochia marina]